MERTGLRLSITDGDVLAPVFLKGSLGLFQHQRRVQERVVPT